jgi:Ca2+/Na+ antiporter
MLHLVGTTVGLILLILLCFVALAIVCDDYLCPALEVICKRHDIPDHVAAASLLALGSAAPELAMNAMATSHVGTHEIRMSVPAIMGSGVIAFGLIPAVCCLAVTSGGSGGSSSASPPSPFCRLTAWPVVRDTTMYAICLVANVFVLEDGTIDAAEAGLLVALFPSYMLVVYKMKAPAWLKEEQGVEGKRGSSALGAAAKNPAAAVSRNPMSASLLASGDGDAPSLLLPTTYGSVQASSGRASGDGGGNGGDGDEGAAQGWCFGKLYAAVAAPFEFVFAHTIPDCELPEEEEEEEEDGESEGTGAELPSVARTAVAFTVSLAYVAGLSSAVLELTKAASDACGVPRAVAGATVLALGAQVPDTIASLAMARSGMLDGAVSNAIGSQVINVTLGTGLPFMLYCLIEAKTIVTNSAGMLFMSFVLGGVVLVYVGVVFAPRLFPAAFGGSSGGSAGGGRPAHVGLHRSGAWLLLFAYVAANVVFISLLKWYMDSGAGKSESKPAG